MIIIIFGINKHRNVTNIIIQVFFIFYITERQCETEKNSCKILDAMGSTTEAGKYATCRYHWKRSLPFNAADKVLLFVNYGLVMFPHYSPDDSILVTITTHS